MIRPRDKGDVPDDPLSRMRHSASHVMADAVRRLRPNAKVAIGPSIETGFYYDFDTEPFAPEDAERIEAEMRKIIAENLRFEQRVVSRAEALELFRARGEIYKVEIIESIPDGRADLVLPARRLHRPLPRPARRAHRRHQGVQGAVVRGRLLARRRAQPPAAARLRHGVPDAPTSSRRTWRGIEEAKRRDHRVLGKTLDLFSMDDLVGPGFVLWHPKGAHRPLPDRGHHPPRERAARLRPGLHAARGARAAARDVGSPRALQREPVRRHGARRPALPGQADELSVPCGDLPLADAVVPRAADTLLGAGNGLPLRALGRAPRPAARARPDHGRRSPLRARGPDRRRDDQLPASSRWRC